MASPPAVAAMVTSPGSGPGREFHQFWKSTAATTTIQLTRSSSPAIYGWP